MLTQNNQQLKDNNILPTSNVLQEQFFTYLLILFPEKVQFQLKVIYTKYYKNLFFYSGIHNAITDIDLKKYTYNVKFAVFSRPNLSPNKKLQDSFEFL